MSKNQSAVLIAEDNAEIAKLIKLYLEGEGYKTVCFYWVIYRRFVIGGMPRIMWNVCG